MSASVSAWLQDLGLQQYAELFEANDIDWELLADIDQQTLTEIGIQSVGHRIRILEAISKLQAPAAGGPAAAAAFTPRIATTANASTSPTSIPSAAPTSRTACRTR